MVKENEFCMWNCIEISLMTWVFHSRGFVGLHQLESCIFIFKYFVLSFCSFWLLMWAPRSLTRWTVISPFGSFTILGLQDYFRRKFNFISNEWLLREGTHQVGPILHQVELSLITDCLDWMWLTSWKKLCASRRFGKIHQVCTVVFGRNSSGFFPGM